MQPPKINIRFIVLLAIILLIGLWRVMDSLDGRLLWNFTSIGAMALFAGYYFSNAYKSYIFPLLILFFSDVILMQTMYSEHAYGLLYKGWYWTYGSFMAMTYIGWLLQHKRSISWLFLGSFLAALTHYAISNFGMWIGGGISLATGQPYAYDLNGLIRCYVAAIPFFKNMVMGTSFFALLLFGGFELAQRTFPVLRIQRG